MKISRLFAAGAVLALLFSPVSFAGNISISVGGGQVNTGVVSCGGSSCVEGSGVKKTEARQVGPFTSVSVDGAYDVRIELQKNQRVEITGDDNVLPRISTKVSGGTLYITTKGTVAAKVPLEVDIAAENIEKVVSDGSNDITVSGVRNNRFTVELNGSGDARLSGKTKEFKGTISGSGSIYAKELRSEDASVSISGAGDAEVYASRRLKARIDGAGGIGYYGNPKDVQKDISGAGDIEKKD